MLSGLSVKKPYTVLVGVILILVLGFVSFTKMSADLLPDINLPYVVIMTAYPGASPETVETVVTTPVEASMATISNIEEIRSMSSENYSVVILEFSQKTNMDSVSLDMRESLDRLEGYWPDEVATPMIMKLNPNMLPTMIAAVGIDDMTPAEAGRFTEEYITPEIESIEGVASVNENGLIEESLHAVISEKKIDAVNKRMEVFINDKFDEAYEKIADGEKEIADGEKGLADAEAEIKKNEKKINDAQKEVDKGRNELTDKQEATAEQLAQAKLELLTAKADLEAAKTSITTNLTTLDKLVETKSGVASKRAELVATKQQLETQQQQLTAMETMLNAVPTQIDGVFTALSGGTIDAATADAQLGTIKAGLDATPIGALIDAQLAGAGLSFDSSAGSAALNGVASGVINGYLNSAEYQAGKDALANGITQVNDGIAQIDAGGAQIDDQISGLTMGMSVDEYKALQNAALAQIAEATAKVDAGILQVYNGETEAIIGFANGAAKLDLTDYQLAVSKAQIEEGKTKIEDSKKQLDDAKEQIEDGKEELEDSKEDALKQADMTATLSKDTVSKILMAQNFSMPAGYVDEGDSTYLIRVGDKPSTEQQLKDMVILKLPMSESEVITLGDVCDIFMTTNQDKVYTNVNGKTGVVLSIQKQTGYSTGTVSDSIKARFDELREQYGDVDIIELMDQGVYIDLVMNTIFENVLIGGLLAVIILIFFLRDIRPTLIIAISIPVSLIAAVVCMYFSGVTLNIISLSGLALGVGMLVDNSIVVIENIYRLRNLGMDVKEAAVKGAREVAGAILASTLTTVSVFLPIVFTEGLTRQLFVDMGLTIAFSLMASLLVALTVVPACAAGMLKKIKTREEGKKGFMYGAYEKFLRLCLKFKPVVLGLSIVLLALSAFLAYQNGMAYFPEMESPQITVSLSGDEEKGVTDVKAQTDIMVGRLSSIEDVIDVGAMASSSTLNLLGATTSAETVRNSTIYVTTAEKRKLSSDELAAKIKELASDFEGVNVSVETATMDMSALGSSGIVVEVKGRDLDKIYSVAEDVMHTMEKVDGVDKVSSGVEDADPELRVHIDREKASLKGLTVATVFTQINDRLKDPSVATTLVTDTEDISVYVESDSDKKLNREDIRELPIKYTNDDGKEETVALKEIADFEDGMGMQTINRKGQTRYVSVSASIAEGHNISFVSNDVYKAIDKLDVPAGCRIEYEGENEMIVDALKQLLLMLVLAVVFIYLIMVAQFQSLGSPFIIMFTIPLAFTGGLFALFMSGYEISIVAMIGFVMLSGIIVNNGIVLVDYINQRRAEGLAKQDAIVDAGVTRLRPVLMTAMTTILALLTMAFSTKMGADMSRPLAIVVIGGMIYGTLMTLVVVPCIYDMFMREKKTEESPVITEES